MFRRSCFTTANALSSKNSHKNAILSQNSIKRESRLSIFLLGKLLLIGGVCRALVSRVSNFYYFFAEEVRSLGVIVEISHVIKAFIFHFWPSTIDISAYVLSTTVKKNNVSDKKNWLTSLLIPSEILILIWFYRKNCQN